MMEKANTTAPKGQARIRRMVLAALLLALGLVLPFVTGQIPEVGNMLLPMHLPVLICGLVCGWKWGAAVGFVLPILRKKTLMMHITAGSSQPLGRAHLIGQKKIIHVDHRRAAVMG